MPRYLPSLHLEGKRVSRQLARLERHWRSQYRPKELRRHLTSLLHRLQDELSRDGADARLVLATYRRMLHHGASARDIDSANKALRRLLKRLGVAAVGLMPMGFVTLPVLFSLAHRFGVELDPGEEPAGTADASRGGHSR